MKAPGGAKRFFGSRPAPDRAVPKKSRVHFVVFEIGSELNMPNPRKPRHLKLLSGTDQRCRRDPAESSAPQFPALSEFLPCPESLSGDGAALWHALGPQLIVAGVLQVTDVFAFEQLCYAWGRFRAKARSGADLTAAEHRVLAALFGEFGVTPAARRRVAATLIDPKPPTNRFAAHRRAMVPPGESA